MMEILDKKCPELRAEAIHVMGTAIQGNQAVQIRVIFVVKLASSGDLLYKLC